MIEIQIVSDPICPFCFVAKRRLDRAPATLGLAIAPRWRPFQLEPDIPEGGVDFLARARARYGDESGHEMRVAAMVKLGQAEGLSFHRDAWARLPQTLHAHRLLYWASREPAAAQHALADAIFVARFEQVRDIGDREVLADIAARVLGWSAAQTHARLLTDEDAALVAGEARGLALAGVTAAPLISVGRRSAVGAQSVETYAAMLRSAANGTTEP